MILVDSGPLIALVDPRDALNRHATADLKRLRRQPLFTCSPVLTEVCFALPARYHRLRLRDLLGRFGVRPCAVGSEESVWSEVLDWLARYAEHAPDWTDGYLAVLSQRERRMRLWTYDAEFRDIWRRPDGSKIPQA